MRFLILWRSIFIFYFCINSTFRLIIDPFTNKQLIFLAKIIWTLTFSFIIHPMTFKVITISFSKNSIPVSFSFMPLSFIDVLICINHSSFSLRISHDPKSVISVSICAKKSSSSMSLVFNEISCIFSLQFSIYIFPIGSLSMSFVLLPHTFILISIFINLNTKTLFHVFSPISNILCWWNPFLPFNCSIFLFFLSLNPVNRSVRTILLCFNVISSLIRLTFTKFT